MTLILFLSLGISNKSIPSEGLIKGLRSELYAARVKSGYGRRAVWLNNSCFLSAKLAVLFGKSKKSALCQIYTCALTVCRSQSAYIVCLTTRPHVCLGRCKNTLRWRINIFISGSWQQALLHYVTLDSCTNGKREYALDSPKKIVISINIKFYLICTS